MVSRTQRHAHLLEQLETGTKPLEVLVEVDYARRDKVAREMDRIGKTTHVFNYIPYVAGLLEPADAKQIANKCFGIDTFYSKLFTGSLSAIKSIDVASEYRIPPMPETKNEVVLPHEEHWHLTNIGAYAAHQYATGSGVNVGIIDTGADYKHPEIAARFGSNKGVDLVYGKDPMDQNGHGTHVSGLVAGKSVGVATNCTLYAIRVLDENGSGSEVGVMQGIEWAMDNDLDIINMSLGSAYATRAFEELCTLAYRQGMVIVAAAGNDGGRYKSYPAAFGESVIAVAAVDNNNSHAYFSNMWETNDISAPGVDVLSSFPGGRYKKLSGTSMASPLACGTLTLGLELADSSLLEGTLADTAKELGFGMDPDEQREWYGAGLAQADALCRRLANANSLQKSYMPKLLEKILSW